MANLARSIHALSLDAVAVSVMWQFVFCISFADQIPTLAQSVSLGLTVWLIYCADRLLDAARIDTQAPVTFRHQFHRRHRRNLTMTWMILLIIDALVVCLGVDYSIQVLGISLAAAVLVYGAGVHFATTPLRRIPKEVQVGFLFAGGVSIVLWPSVFAEPTTHLPMLVTFGLAWALFTCNCIFVAACELELDHAQGFDSLPGRLMDRGRSFAGGILIASNAGFGVVSWGAGWSGFAPWKASSLLAISFALLAVISLFSLRRRLSGSVPLDGFPGGILPAGFVADSTLFIPPIFFVPWLI